MEKGIYTPRPKDFSKLIVDKFAPQIFNTAYNAIGGCGANALSVLTGINPLDIKNTNPKNKNDWKDKFVVDFLRDCGFTVEPITLCDVSNSEIYVESPITKNHVLLISQLLIKNEASWSVIYKDYIFHNFEIVPLKGLEFVNNPILTAYIVWSPAWKDFKFNK